MSDVLEIVKLENGEIILRDTDTDSDGREREPLLRLRFSDELIDMLGDDVVAVAEAMIDAASAFLSGADVDSPGNTTKSSRQRGSHILH